jgi:hypothetical protein
VNLAVVRTVQLLPAFLARLIDQSCAIRMSGGQVSSCPRADTRAPPFGLGGARACFSHRIAKGSSHDPDILSLRQGCQSLATGDTDREFSANFDRQASATNSVSFLGLSPPKACKTVSFFVSFHRGAPQSESCSSFRSSEEPHAGFTTVVLGCLT